MSLSWSDFPDAPDVGATLCRLADIPKRGVLSATLRGFPFLVLCGPDGPRAFVNACPHQFLPLDQRGDAIMAADGAHLLCTNHGARFAVSDGRAVDGPAGDCALSRIPVRLSGGALLVAAG